MNLLMLMVGIAIAIGCIAGVWYMAERQDSLLDKLFGNDDDDDGGIKV